MVAFWQSLILHKITTPPRKAIAHRSISWSLVGQQGALQCQKSCWQPFLHLTGFSRLLQSLHWLGEFCRNMNGEVTLEEVEQVMLLLLFSILLLLQVVLLLSCRVRDIQISHWLGLLNAHWKVYPRGRDWLVYTGLMWVAMEIMTTMHLLCQC